MRYHDEQDVAMWVDCLLGLLPTVLARFAAGPACAS
jgi:hypothetical protein